MAVDFELKERLKALIASPKVTDYITGIPVALYNVFDFTNMTSRDVFALEWMLEQLDYLEPTRNTVMLIQRQCGLPLRPNQGYEECKKFARLKAWKEKKERDKYLDKYSVEE